MYFKKLVPRKYEAPVYRNNTDVVYSVLQVCMKVRREKREMRNLIVETLIWLLAMCHKKGNQISWKQIVTGRIVLRSLIHKKNLSR